MLHGGGAVDILTYLDKIGLKERRAPVIDDETEEMSADVLLSVNFLSDISLALVLTTHTDFLRFRATRPFGTVASRKNRLLQLRKTQSPVSYKSSLVFFLNPGFDTDLSPTLSYAHAERENTDCVR